MAIRQKLECKRNFCTRNLYTVRPETYAVIVRYGYAQPEKNARPLKK